MEVEEERSHLLDFFEDQDAMWRVDTNDMDGSLDEDDLSGGSDDPASTQTAYIQNPQKHKLRNLRQSGHSVALGVESLQKKLEAYAVLCKQLGGSLGLDAAGAADQ